MRWQAVADRSAPPWSRPPRPLAGPDLRTKPRELLLRGDSSRALALLLGGSISGRSTSAIHRCRISSPIFSSTGAFAERLPPRSAFLLLSDHGFVEDPEYDPAAPHDRPRYRHGGDSPFEVVVPVATLLRL